MLYNSLSGECEQELEHLELSKIHAPGGVDFIMESLKGPMEAKEVFQKRQFIQQFENIYRYPNEHLRQFAHRYRRLERNLPKRRRGSLRNVRLGGQRGKTS